MANVKIAYESASVDLAEQYAQKLHTDKDDITLICRQAFPIADSIFPFLAELSKTADYALIVMPSPPLSSSSIWIARELHLQHALGNFTNIYPAFLHQTDVPEWWDTDHSTVRALRQQH